MWPLFILERGATIGIKSRHIEWSRLDGRGAIAERATNSAQIVRQAGYATRWAAAQLIDGCGSLRGEGGPSGYGSGLLGISEVPRNTGKAGADASNDITAPV